MDSLHLNDLYSSELLTCSLSPNNAYHGCPLSNERNISNVTINHSESFLKMHYKYNFVVVAVNAYG